MIFLFWWLRTVDLATLRQIANIIQLLIYWKVTISFSLTKLKKLTPLKNLLYVYFFIIQQQFFTQAKSGINRVGIIALLEKVLSIQIYQ